ncbi:hypothetical protein HID58_023323 [Brassica napus]|uniref:Uncharacterized protein n=1 Tax=Brassica napus TaxID=3708 RepID=A0ABQ8D447_BRANA|nr:hypothetical protein HID58_023323 [Brassica napus]
MDSWNPGIRAGDWVDSIYGDHNKDYGNQGFYLARFGRDTGIEKGICGSLRKSNIWVQGRWSLDAIEIDLRIFTGCILDRDSFISFSYLMEMGLFYLTEAWVHWYLWGSRSESIKLQRYGLIVEYLRTPASAVREEGEIKGTGDDAATDEFQLELAKTQAEGSEAIIDTTEEEMGLLKLKGVMEQHEDIAADIDMEIEAIHASILENGGDVEVEEEFQTLSEEEAEQVAEVDGEEELVSGEVDSNNETVADDMAMRHSNRRRLLKPSTAGSNKMRMASSLLSPRKRAAAKVGTRQGDGGKLSERKGPSNPKSTNLKF